VWGIDLIHLEIEVIIRDNLCGWKNAPIIVIRKITWKFQLNRTNNRRINLTHPENREANRFGVARSLSFRGIQNEWDYPILLAILQESRKADKDNEEISLEEMVKAFTPSPELDPTRDVLIASLAGGSTVPIGYSRVGWYSSREDTQLYYQISHLLPEYRGGRYWQAMVQQNELRLREISKGQPAVPHRFFQAWASDNQADWISVLQSTGYSVVRRFNNMLHQLENIPDLPLPDGFEIRPVKPEHMRRIWEAQKEMNQGLFENVSEDWLEVKYPEWLNNPSNTPQFWQLAWVGDQIAGMVLARIEGLPEDEKAPQRGFTEHIFVKPPWRKRGLAGALIAQSLRVLKANGMQAAELGVDSDNESAAFYLYQKMGYKTFSVDTWFRKAMD
jgi:mycothiol synthase